MSLSRRPAAARPWRRRQGQFRPAQRRRSPIRVSRRRDDGRLHDDGFHGDYLDQQRRNGGGRGDHHERRRHRGWRVDRRRDYLGRRRLDRRRRNDGRRAGGGATTAVVGVSNGVTRDRGPGQVSFGVVRLRDVGRMGRPQNYNAACSFDGQPSVGLNVFQLPGTNALDVAEAVRQRIKELEPSFPPWLKYEIGYDTTPFIRESIADVIRTLFEAIVLVGLVVLVFLQDWRAMILPMIDVPVSLIGTFAVMARWGIA